MKHKNSLNFKKILYITLPCLMLTLMMGACSNEDSAILPESTIEIGLSFTATNDVIAENSSTRIGLDESKIPESADDAEPVIWLNGDKFSFHFLKYGAKIGQIVEYVSSNVKNEGMACTMSPVEGQGINLEDGLYKVHVLAPGKSTNFSYIDYTNVDVASTINLSGQNQPAATNSYSNLNNYYYQYAHTVVEIKNNKIVSGSTNLSFKTLTSMLRFLIKNQLEKQVKVKSISLNYANPNNQQFYSKGLFYPFNETNPLQTASDAEFNEAYITTNQVLDATLGSSFNAYMSIFPTDGYLSGSSERLNIVIKLDVDNQPKKAVWDLPVSTFDTKDGTYCKFPAGSRYMFTLNLRDNTLQNDESPTVNPDGSTNIQVGENIYKTFTYPTGPNGEPQVWMVENSCEGGDSYDGLKGNFYKFQNSETACPGLQWRVPSIDEFIRLSETLNANPTSGPAKWWHNANYGAFNGYIDENNEIKVQWTGAWWSNDRDEQGWRLYQAIPDSSGLSFVIHTYFKLNVRCVREPIL